MTSDRMETREISAEVLYPDKFKQGGNGGGGGDMLDKLERRVAQVESDVTIIRQNVGILTERSANFATSLDCQEIKTELAAISANLQQLAPKTELATLNANFCQLATKTELYKEVSSQTKWIIGSFITVAGLALSIAAYIFK